MKKLTDVTLGEGITSIGSSAFAYCTALETIVFPSTLKEIGFNCFYGCTSLKSANLPAGLTNIGHDAFSRTGSLTLKVE